MDKNRQMLIDHLTGIHSSKLTHYADLKAHVAEVEQRNAQLEILNRIAKSIRVDMSIGEMIGGIRQSLGRLIPSLHLQLHAVGGNGTAGPESEEPVGDLHEHLQWVTTHFKTLLILPETVEAPDAPWDIRKTSGLQTVVLIPLLTRKAMAGVLAIGCPDTRALMAVGISFLEQLGDQLAAALTNNQLYAEVLQRQQEWLLTFNAIKNPVLVLDRQGRVLQSNEASIRFPPAQGDGYTGKPWWRTVLGNVAVPSPCMVTEAVSTGKPVSKRFKDEAGNLFDVSVYPLIKIGGRQSAVADSDVVPSLPSLMDHQGAIVYAKDVSDEIRYQAQLVQSARLAAIGQMAAGVAHELNSPLTVILGNTQLLLRSLQAADAMHPLLRDMLTCGARCSRIIQDLLAFSRQDETSFAPTDLNAVVRRVLSLLHHQLEQGQVRVESDLAPDLPAIQGNEYRVEQVLINLILNARDAVLEPESEERRVVRVTTGVRETRYGPRVIITVRDNGTGIQPQHLAEIFQPFFSTKAPGKGTGLGLWVSLGIAEAHGGTLEVDSEWGQGSAFSLVLPAIAERGDSDDGDEASAPNSGSR